MKMEKTFSGKKVLCQKEMWPYIEKKVLVTVVSRYMLMNSMNLGLFVFLLTFLIIFNFVKYQIGLPVVDLLELWVSLV